jgi:hypothetical protein
MIASFYWLVLGVLCVWRVTHLFNAEDGPWRLFVRFRQFAGNGFWGELLDCFYCLSLWVAAPVACILGNSVKERLFLWPSLSAAAILLERISRRGEPEQPQAVYFEDDKENNDVLREEQAEYEERGGSEPRAEPGKPGAVDTPDRPGDAGPDAAL